MTARASGSTEPRVWSRCRRIVSSRYLAAPLGLTAVLTGCASSTAIEPKEGPVVLEVPPDSMQLEPVAPDAGRPCYAEPVRFAAQHERYAAKEPESDLASELVQCAAHARRMECRYGVAREWFDLNRYERAAPLFLDIALDPGAGELAIYAAQLGLESLNVLGTHADPPRPACFDAMLAVVPKLIDNLCTGMSRDEETCAILERIRFDGRRLEAERLVKDADAGAPNRLGLYRRAGEIYWDLASKEDCLGGAATRENAGRCAEVVYNASRAFRAAGETARADEATEALFDPMNRLDQTGLVRNLKRNNRPMSPNDRTRP